MNPKRVSLTVMAAGIALILASQRRAGSPPPTGAGRGGGADESFDAVGVESETTA